MKKKTRIGLYSVSILFMILLGLCSTVIAASTSYQMGGAEHFQMRGTEHYQVSQFDEKAWGSTVDDWFNGANDKSEAESKKTTFHTYSSVWGTDSVMARVIFPAIVGQEKAVLYSALMKEFNYDQEYVNSTYKDKYEITCAVQAEWYYTINGLNETANFTNCYLTLFKDPKAYSNLWRDYNSLANELNSRSLITFYAGTLPKLTKDEFLWKLVLKGIAVGVPTEEYLTTLTTELGCSTNVEVNGNVLSFQKSGKESYDVEITYGMGQLGIMSSLRTMSSFAVKNADNNIVYMITTTHSSTSFYFTIVFLVISCAGLVYYAIQRRTKMLNS